MAEPRPSHSDLIAEDDGDGTAETLALLLPQQKTEPSASTPPQPQLAEEHVEPADLDRLPWFVAYFFYGSGEGDVRVVRAVLAALVFLTVAITMAIALVCVRHGHAHPVFELWLPAFMRSSPSAATSTQTATSVYSASARSTRAAA